MEFLFNMICFTHPGRQMYSISQVTETDFLAESQDSQNNICYIRKTNNGWTGEGDFSGEQFRQIGDRIDKILYQSWSR
jgi:hypothetical protein